MQRPLPLAATAGAATLLALLLGRPAAADDATPLDELVVTATRLPATAQAAPDVQVVTARDIELRQATFAFDVLSTLPGVQASRSGGFGGVTSVKIRGASSDKTLVLIDGAAVNDPASPAGGFDFSSLDLAQVERIEVLSGPQGSLWGSDAIGGVVSVVTREPAGWRGSVEAGAFGTERATAAAGVASEGHAIGVDAAWFSSGGISKADVRDGNSERDGFRSFTAQANGRISAGEALTLDGRLRYNRARSDGDSFGGPTGVIDGPDSQSSRTVSGFLRARMAGPLGFSQELRADGMDLDRTSNSFFGGAIFPFRARGRRLDLRWTAERSDLGPHALLVGVERETAREDTGDGRQTARNLAGFAVWRFAPAERLSTTVSLRRDAPRDVKAVTTVRAAAVLALGGGASLSGSFGQGFKAPSIYQRTYPCFECATPGPAVGLRPEHAEGWDVGLHWRTADGRTTARLTLYRLSVRDEIDYRYPGGYLNIARARTGGAEAEADVALIAGVSLHAGYAYAEARDLSTGAALLRVPRHSGSASLQWTGGRAEAAITVRAQSRGADVEGQIRPFAVVDLAGSYALTPAIRLTARIENLADTHYQQAFGYGEPGFGAFFGVKLGGS